MSWQNGNTFVHISSDKKKGEKQNKSNSRTWYLLLNQHRESTWKETKSVSPPHSKLTLVSETTLGTLVRQGPHKHGALAAIVRWRRRKTAPVDGLIVPGRRLEPRWCLD